MSFDRTSTSWVNMFKHTHAHLCMTEERIYSQKSAAIAVILGSARLLFFNIDFRQQ